MSNKVAGGKQAAITNRDRYGVEFYREIGALGGQRTHESGQLAKVDFKADPKRAKTAGAKGGRIAGFTWTTERRLAHSIKMKRYWKHQQAKWWQFWSHK